MIPYNGSNPKSILVMDNCVIPHIQEVSWYTSGIFTIILSGPQSNRGSFVKYYLREHNEVSQALSTNPTEIIKSAFNEITAEHCKGWVRHAGYGD